MSGAPNLRGVPTGSILQHTTFEIWAWNVYTIYLLSEKIVDFLKYVRIAILFVFGVVCFVASSAVEQNVCSISACC